MQPRVRVLTKVESGIFQIATSIEKKKLSINHGQKAISDAYIPLRQSEFACKHHHRYKNRRQHILEKYIPVFQCIPMQLIVMASKRPKIAHKEGFVSHQYCVIKLESNLNNRSPFTEGYHKKS